MTKTAAPTTRDMMAALRAKYAGKSEAEWAGGFYLEECGINGGGEQSRCDALYAGFTSASGRLLIGHEVKISRSDWLAELKKLGKADFWHDNCHQWYVVAHSGVLSKEELPEGWGLMYLQGGRLITQVRPTTRPVAPSWVAVRSMLSRAETLRAESVRSARNAAQDEVRRELDRLRSELQAAEQSGGLGRGPQAERWRRIIVTAEQRIRTEGDHHGAVPEDLIVDALVDAATMQAAAVQLRQQLEHTVRDANRVLADIRGGYGPLKKILEGMA